MAAPAFDSLLRHFSLLAVVVIAASLLYGRSRAASLEQAGRVTTAEVSSFSRGAFAVLGGAFVAFWVVQVLAGAQNLQCLIHFPPRQAAGIAVWLIQAGLSGTILWWLWARNGAEVLARLAPAFTHGPVLDRRFDASRVRLFVSAVAILAPLGNVILQLAGHASLPSCEAI